MGTVIPFPVKQRQPPGAKVDPLWLRDWQRRVDDVMTYARPLQQSSDDAELDALAAAFRQKVERWQGSTLSSSQEGKLRRLVALFAEAKPIVP